MILAPALGGCDDDDGPSKLFDERGTWSLSQFAADSESLLQSSDGPSGIRRDAFLLQFDPDLGAVAAATCAGSNAPDNDTPSNSSCRRDTAQIWTCSCYGYSFVDSAMVWQEYAPGETPPKPKAPADFVAGTDEGSVLTVGEVNDAAFTYLFFPLPEGLFGSNGTTSRHVFVQKADSVYAPTGCAEQCFGE
jgi:hypothetical protein